MAVKEANGDATEFRSIPRGGLGNKPFSDMSDAELRGYVDRGAAWQKGTPEGFDPWNSWGGHYTAERTDKSNAERAAAELARRAKEP